MEGALAAGTPPALAPLFEAKSVVIVGVSDDPRKQGRVVLRNILGAGFRGKLHAIGRNLQEIDGIRCLASASELTEPVDVAFLAIPAEATAGALRQLASMPVKFAIIGAAGFAENGDEAGIARQRELASVVAETGIRIVGPNCNGIYNAHHGLSIGFNTAHSKRLPPGDVAILSHSGALFDAMAGRLGALGAGLSIFVSAGNEVDLDLLDYLEFAVADAHTKVVAMLLDGISDGNRFRRLADRARREGKKIVVLHVGTSAAGAATAVAHSSRLAGTSASYAALFEASGVPAVSSIESLMTAAALLSFYGKVTGGLAAMSSSGAGAALLADLAAKYAIPLAPLSPATSAAISALKRFSQAANPTDLGNFQGVARREEVPSLIAADAGVGAVIVLTQSFRMESHPLIDGLVRARQSTGKPFLLVAPGGLAQAEQRRFEEGGLRVLMDTESTLQGIAAMMAAERIYPQPPVLPSAAAETLLDLGRPLTEPESLALLGRFGIATVATRTCHTPAEAIAAADALGWPVVVKAVVEGVAHKSDAGLVRLRIATPQELRAAHAEFGSPQTMVVQALVKGRVEAIAGLTTAPGVGKLLLAGLGGVHAEALDAVTLWPLPTTRSEIERKLNHGPLGRILASARWADRESRAAFVDALLALQVLALWAGERLAAVDINPLILGDGRAVAVDALVVPTRPA